MARDQPGGARSAFWGEVRAVAETSRQRVEEFDPAAHGPDECVREGIAPIVSLYVRVSRRGDSLSEVERSLLSGVLNDWLAAYAACHETGFEGGYTVREVALQYATNGSLEETVADLVGV